MSAGQIRIVLDLDDSSFSTGITRAGTQLTQLNSHLNTGIKSAGTFDASLSRIGYSLREFVVTASLAKGAIQNINAVTFGAMKSIADTNGEIEKMTALMTGMSKATTAAAQAQDGIKDTNFIINMAKNSPVAINGLTDAFVKLKTTGIDPTKGAMQALVDANAHFGGTEDNLKRASVAISQMASKGKVSMEELRQQLAEAIPNASQLMARGMGVSMDDFIDKVSKGSVNAKEAIALMMNEFEIEFSGSAAKMMNTWVGLTSQLSTEWSLFQKHVGDASYFDEAKKSIRELIEGLKSQEAEAFAASFGHALGDITKNLVEMIKYVLQNREEIAKLGETILVTIVAFKSFGALESIIRGLAGVVITAGPAFRVLVAAIIEGGGVIAATGGLVTTLGVALGGLSIPLAVVAAALAAGGIAWFNWGNSASEALSKAEQSLKDGVAFSKAQIDDLTKTVNEGKAATDRETAWVNTNAVGKGMISLFGGGYDVGKDNKAIIDGRAAQVKLEMNQSITLTDLASKTKVEALDKAFKEEDRAAAEIASKEKEANQKRFLGKKADKEAYDRENDEIEKRRLAKRIAGYQKATNDLTKGASHTDASQLGLISTSHQDQLQIDYNNIEINQQNLYGVNKKAQEAAAKAAAREAEQRQHALNTSDAQLAKKVAQFNQPFASRTGIGIEGVGPEEARLKTLIERGENYSEVQLKTARSIDVVNKANQDKAKIEEFLVSLGKQTERTNEKLITDNTHLKDVMNNGGYETMSKATLRYNEQLAVNLQRLDDDKQALLKNADAYGVVGLKARERIAELDAEAEKLKTASEETKRLANENDILSRSGQYLKNAKAVNVSLIGNTQDRLAAQKDLEIAAVMETNNVTAEMLATRAKLYEGINAEIASINAKYARETESPLKTIARNWDDMGQNIRQASTGWMTSFSDEMSKMVISGKADFRSLTVSILSDLAKIMTQKALAGLANLAMGATGSLLGGGLSTAGDGTPITSSLGGTGLSGWGSLSSLGLSRSANGNIMTPDGPLPLNMFANGGIARQPQVSIFGEGRTPEAYVPLPDGRSIPVTMKGANGGGAEVTIQISVDNRGNSSTDQKNNSSTGSQGDMWGKMAENVKTIVVQTIAEQKRPGGQLWRA